MRIEYVSFSLNQKIYRRLGENLFTGPVFEFSRQYSLEFFETSGDPLPRPDIEGGGGHRSTGLGWALAYDSRDNTLSPSSGAYIETGVTGYSKTIVGSHNYTSAELDIRKYIPFSRKGRTLLALQGVSRNTWGRVPAQKLPALGGREIMRGYYEGRYRDKHLAAVQAELRSHISGRVRGVLFASAGGVGSAPGDIFRNRVRYSGGLGLRYMLIPGNGGNLRFDYGWGGESSGFYITFGEAF